MLDLLLQWVVKQGSTDFTMFVDIEESENALHQHRDIPSSKFDSSRLTIDTTHWRIGD